MRAALAQCVFFGKEQLHMHEKQGLRQAAIAQLGERQTEDLKVPGSIPGLGMAVWSLANELRVHPALATA